MTGAEIELWTPSEIQVWAEETGATPRMLEVALKLNELSAPDNSIDSSVVNIMESILNAEDENEIFAAVNKGTVASKNYLNQPFLLKGSEITWKRSALVYRRQKGFPWYSLPKVIDLTTGEERILNAGGWTFVFCLYRLLEVDAFSKYEEDGGMPMILTGKAAASGYTVVLPNRYQAPKAVKDATKTRAKTEK